MDLTFSFTSICTPYNNSSMGSFVLLFYILVFDRFMHLLLTQVVSVVLENYGDVKEDSQNENAMRLYSWRMVVNDRGEVNVPV